MSTLDQISSFNYGELGGGCFPPHQLAGIEFLLGHPRVVLADDVGLGKTVQTAAALAELAGRGQLGRCLVVAPAHLVSQWRDELVRWVPALAVSLFSPLRRKGAAAPTEPADVVVGSYELITRKAQLVVGSGYRTVVLDEASGLKGGGVEHAAIRWVTAVAERVIALTATPFENDLVETYNVLQTLHLPDLWGPIEFNQRFVRWSEPWVNSAGRRVEARPIGVVEDQIPALRDYLRPHYLRRTAAEVALPLPRRVGEHIRYIPLLPAQQAALAKAEYERDELARHRAREAACTVVDGRSSKAEAAVAELLTRPADQKVVIWAFHRAHLDVLEALLDRCGIRRVRIDGPKPPLARARALRRFREDPTVRVLLGTDAFASGLNLQHADFMISLGVSHNPGKEAQREGRIRRIGSPHADYQHLVLLNDTPHERRKVEILRRKEADATTVFGGWEDL